MLKSNDMRKLKVSSILHWICGLKAEYRRVPLDKPKAISGTISIIIVLAPNRRLALTRGL